MSCVSISYTRGGHPLYQGFFHASEYMKSTIPRPQTGGRSKMGQKYMSSRSNLFIFHSDLGIKFSLDEFMYVLQIQFSWQPYHVVLNISPVAALLTTLKGLPRNQILSTGPSTAWKGSPASFHRNQASLTSLFLVPCIFPTMILNTFECGPHLKLDR